MGFHKYIKAFFGNMESQDEFFKRKGNETADIIAKLPKEQQVEVVNSLNNLEQLKNGLCELYKSDYITAILLASFTVALASCIDNKGKNIEKWINTRDVKINGMTHKFRDVDTNNPFDILAGNGHRTKLFHDFNILKKINDDFVLRNGSSIEMIMKGGKNSYRLIELIERRYDTKNFVDIAKIIILHYAKDAVTQEGLPIIGSSLLTKSKKNCDNVCGYSFDNIFYKNVANELSSCKLSDLSSYSLSKIVIFEYSNAIAKERGLNNKQKKNYTRLMKIVTWTMMIAIQMFLLDKGVKEGGRLNLVIIPEMICESVSMINNTINEHREVIAKYEKMNKIIKNSENKIIRKEYSGIEKEPYFFENNNYWYISEEKILVATQEVIKEASEQEQKQIIYLKETELLKYNLANNIININEYRISLEKLMREFYLENKFCGLDKTEILLKFYKVVNELYRGDNDNEK